jgi:hypothetical protein
VPNITTTNIDLSRVALEVWGVLAAVLQNVEVTDQSYLEGTLLTRNPANGKLIPFAASAADTIVDVTVDVASLAANTETDTAVVVPGALVGDSIVVTPLGTWPAGLTAPQGRCLVAGTVQVRIGNVTAAPIDPASQSFRFSLQHDLGAPEYVLTYPVTVTASSDGSVTVLSAGKVNQRLLKVHGAPPTAATADQIHALLNRPIIPVDGTQLAKIDNPQ